MGGGCGTCMLEAAREEGDTVESPSDDIVALRLGGGGLLVGLYGMNTGEPSLDEGGVRSVEILTGTTGAAAGCATDFLEKKGMARGGIVI